MAIWSSLSFWFPKWWVNTGGAVGYHWFLKETEERKTFRWEGSKILLRLLWCISKHIYWPSHFRTILNASVWGLIYDYLATSNVRGHVFINFKEVISRIKRTAEFPASCGKNLITLYDSSKNKLSERILLVLRRK